jgi:L-asparaginase
MAQSKVVLITTGGTISTRDSGAGAVPKLGGADLLATLGDSLGGLAVEVIDFARTPGCEMAPAMMADLARVIDRELARDEVAGAVVTHGTDTIEESAFVTYLTVASDKPAVFTGSMRTSSELSWDGPRNLLDAFKIAAWPSARGLGALLVMNEEIHSARFVTKGYGLVLGAFHSPACGPLGKIYNGEPMLFTCPAFRRETVAPELEPEIGFLTALSGGTTMAAGTLAQAGLRGLVVEGFGAGRVPLSWCDPLAAAVGRGMPVVLASRTGGGAIGDPYGYRGATYLRSIGLIAAHEMPGHKARLKLMLALGNGMNGDALRRFFESELLQ